MGSANTPSNVRPADEHGESPRPSDASANQADSEGRTLRRGLLLLDTVQRAGDAGLRVVELCRASGLQRATVHRLLATLLDTGHVQRAGRFHYVAAARREPQAAGASDLALRIAPVLARVSKACGDAAFAVVREGHSSWCIARHVGAYPVQILSVQVGARQPLGVGAAGLALLAALSDDEAEAAIHGHGVMLARYGGMTPERLELLVRNTRERGWAVVGNHAVQGALGVGRAVCDAEGQPLAGISVAASTARMTSHRQRWIAGLMKEALADWDRGAG
ncbi:IclR family transcriptional regulator [Rubrivivax gelatinosus]|nr:IclR family transcriptional regulator [Rubrivivax gelatinosus]